MAWIKLHRQLLDSEVFASEKALKIWIWMLLKARFNKGFVPIKIGAGQQTIEIKRGQLIFGRFSAEEQLNINGSTIYKWIKKFEEMGMISIESNSHYTLISILKFKEYNEESNSQATSNEQPSNSQVTAASQASDSRVTQKKKEEEGKEVKKVEDDEESKFSPPTSSLKNIEVLKTKFLSDELWIEKSAISLTIEKEKVNEWLNKFVEHLAISKDFAKTERDFAKHFLSWTRIQLAPKSKTAGKNGYAMLYPDHYDATFEKKLSGQELSKYWQHLRDKGLKPKKNRFNEVTEWI